ncbi:flagellar hook-length control protein FliK [Sediminibacillus halophilus]|uniref:Hook-length control protein FliK n=1 Tax=Sediminibacillus halophilus TaxID=482461 RepID=A0A1G9MK59_9BACI|nr:flagellar hook-length control protein FliK [Sediminibacillus halophilus]SDL74025.1 hook-length control protein FliK [Sediminibacillus halophilus]
MNSIGLFNVQPNTSLTPLSSSEEGIGLTGLTTAFKELMMQNSSESDEEKTDAQGSVLNGLLSTLKSLGIELSDEDLAKLDALSPQVQEVISEMLQNETTMEKLSEDHPKMGPTELIAVLIQNVKNVVGKEKLTDGPLTGKTTVALPTTSEQAVAMLQNQQAVLIQPVASTVDHESKQSFQMIWEQAKIVLGKIDAGNPTKEQEASLKQLLQQWVNQEKVAGKTNMAVGSNNENSFKGETKLQNVWQQLVKTFRSRDNLSAQNRYPGNSSVTSADIGKWIKQALARQSDEGPSNQAVASQQQVNSMPISKVEQYVVHLNQTGSQEANQKQLTETLQKAIQESNFLKSNGTRELSIKLRPAQLGDVMVKMTQLNGEMTVKITVTSQAAKDMLEGNLHQLKHMFSPQQVVVEKQDAQLLQQDNRNNGQQSNSNMDQSEQENDYPQDESRESSEEDSEGKSFSDFLMNEKV